MHRVLSSILSPSRNMKRKWCCQYVWIILWMLLCRFEKVQPKVESFRTWSAYKDHTTSIAFGQIDYLNEFKVKKDHAKSLMIAVQRWNTSLLDYILQLVTSAVRILWGLICTVHTFTIVLRHSKWWRIMILASSRECNHYFIIHT